MWLGILSGIIVGLIIYIVMLKRSWPSPCERPLMYLEMLEGPPVAQFEIKYDNFNT